MKKVNNFQVFRRLEFIFTDLNVMAKVSFFNGPFSNSSKLTYNGRSFFLKRYSVQNTNYFDHIKIAQ